MWAISPRMLFKWCLCLGFQKSSHFWFFWKIYCFLSKKTEFFQSRQTWPIFSRVRFEWCFWLTLLKNFKNWSFLEIYSFFWKHRRILSRKKFKKLGFFPNLNVACFFLECGTKNIFVLDYSKFSKFGILLQKRKNSCCL